MCFEDDRNKRRVTTRIHCIEWSMRRIIVTYHLVKSTLWIEKFFSFSFFFLLSSVRSYQIGLFSTTMRIFSGSGIEKSDLLRVETSRGIRSKKGEKEEKWKSAYLLDSRPISILRVLRTKADETTTTTTTTFKRDEIGQTREGKAKFTRFSFLAFPWIVTANSRWVQ